MEVPPAAPDEHGLSTTRQLERPVHHEVHESNSSQDLYSFWSVKNMFYFCTPNGFPHPLHQYSPAMVKD